MEFLLKNRKRRKLLLPVKGKVLNLPAFFPSISSIKTGLSPFEYYNILIALGQPHFLVSAFDIDRANNKDEFIDVLKKNQKSEGAVILMDSGNYESWWTRDKSWDSNSFNNILGNDICDLAFCFDEQIPPDNVNRNASIIAESINLSNGISKISSLIPIIHGKKEALPSIIKELYSKTHFSMVAVPERTLGDGILERIQTVTNIRKELDKFEEYTYLHLLGTGNPLSLMLFAYAGADSFDGLEWCQTSVNPQTLLLYHFQQRDFFSDNCKFCNSDLDYTLKTLGHNLSFYHFWMQEIQLSIQNEREVELIEKWLSPEFIEKLNQIWE